MSLLDALSLDAVNVVAERMTWVDTVHLRGPKLATVVAPCGMAVWVKKGTWMVFSIDVHTGKRVMGVFTRVSTTYRFWSTWAGTWSVEDGLLRADIEHTKDGWTYSIHKSISLNDVIPYTFQITQPQLSDAIETDGWCML